MTREQAADNAVVAVSRFMVIFSEAANDSEFRDMDIVAGDFLNMLVKYASPAVAKGIAKCQK